MAHRDSKAAWQANKASIYKTKSQPPFTSLQIVTAKDCHIPELVEIHIAAFENDRLVKHGYTEQEHRNKTREMLKDDLEDSYTQVVICVDQLTQRKVGFARLSYMGPHNQERLKVKTSGARTGAKEKKPEPDLNSTLALMRTQRRDMLISHIGGRTFFLLNTLCVSPDLQSRGAGSCMMNWIFSYIKDGGLDCWVESSEAAYKFYEPFGFVSMNHVCVDLASFGDSVPYKIYGMRRKGV